jgi:hypothetical protein
MNDTEMVTHKVRLSRAEFADVAAGRYVPGQVPQAGPPETTVTVVDKRGRRAPKDDRDQLRKMRKLLATLDAQAVAEAQARHKATLAGRLWWTAQAAGQRGDVPHAQAMLATRTGLLER